MIDRTSKVPLYHQLYEMLLGKIESGELAPGDMLPTENELLEQYQLSRNTVRQALNELVNSGWVVRQRGRGSFVTRRPIEQGLNRIISFTEDMRNRGLTPGTEIISAELIPATEHLAAALGIAKGEELAHLTRLRLADGEPMSVEESYLVHRYCPGILGRDYAQTPLREELQRTYGICLVYATQTIRAVPASADLARTLGLERSSAILLIERISFSQENQPVEYLRLHHRGDRYVLHNELQDEYS